VGIVPHLIIWQFHSNKFIARPVSNCAALARSNSAFSIISVASTSLLFYLRVCAIYGMAKKIVVGFGIVWLICFGMALTIWSTFGAAHVGTTHYCVEMVKGHLLGSMLFVVAANETLIYLAIALRIMQMFPTESGSVTRRLRLIGTASSLPKFSKALLHDSQTYFLYVILEYSRDSDR
jgi:hypothetical protein